MIVSHQKKSGDMMIFEDPEDLDCDGSCEDETTSHVPGKCWPVEAPRAILVGSDAFGAPRDVTLVMGCHPMTRILCPVSGVE